MFRIRGWPTGASFWFRSRSLLRSLLTRFCTALSPSCSPPRKTRAACGSRKNDEARQMQEAERFLGFGTRHALRARKQKRRVPPLGMTSREALTRAVNHQTVQRQLCRLERFELDLGVTPGSDFAPAVHAGHAFGAFLALHRTQKFARIVSGRLLSRLRPRQRFDRVAAQQLRPVVAEQLGRGEDVAPGNFRAVSDDDADHALALQVRGGAFEALLHLFDEGVNRHAHGARVVHLGVRLRRRIGSHSALDAARGKRLSGAGASGIGPRGRARADRVPNLLLLLVYRGSLADAG